MTDDSQIAKIKSMRYIYQILFAGGNRPSIVRDSAICDLLQYSRWLAILEIKKSP